MKFGFVDSFIFTFPFYFIWLFEVFAFILMRWSVILYSWWVPVLPTHSPPRYLDCVEVLIEHNIDLNLGNEDRETALHVAANFGRATTVKHLIDK